MRSVHGFGLLAMQPQRLLVLRSDPQACGYMPTWIWQASARTIRLLGPRITAGDAAPKSLGLGCQLAAGLGLDHPQQQPVRLVAVLLVIHQLQQRLGQVEGGDQIVSCHCQRWDPDQLGRLEGMGGIHRPTDLP